MANAPSLAEGDGQDGVVAGKLRRRPCMHDALCQADTSLELCFALLAYCTNAVSQTAACTSAGMQECASQRDAQLALCVVCHLAA